MSEGRRRALLYGGGVLLAAVLLFAGFGISVPPDAATRLNGANFLAGMGNYDEALAVCEVVLEEHPDSFDARVFKASILAMAGRYDESIDAYDDALRHAADDDTRRDLSLDRASVLLQAGRLDEFERAHRRIALEHPGYPAAMLDGLAAEHAKQWGEAVAAYAKANELAGEDPQSRARLWNALMEHGRASLEARRFEDASKSFEQATGLFPRATDAHLKAAEVRLAMGQPRKAVALLSDTRPGTPGVAPLVFRAASRLLAQGERTAALDALARALASDERSVRELFSRESAWGEVRNDSDVRAVLETKHQTNQAGLTGPGTVIDSEGAVRAGGPSSADRSRQ